jgi:hypothetical protein
MLLRSGRTIVSSTQIVDGIVANADLAADAVKNNVVATDAAIAYSKLALTGAVKAADIEAAAAIPDSKLAQITTASKVSGAALTSLASIPAGAGVIPAANVPAVFGGKVLQASRDISAASGDQVIAHGLGRTPSYVKVTAYIQASIALANYAPFISIGAYDGTNSKLIAIFGSGSGSANRAVTALGTHVIRLYTDATGSADRADATVAVDATNVTISWTKTGSPTGSAEMLIEVFG